MDKVFSVEQEAEFVRFIEDYARCFNLDGRTAAYRIYPVVLPEHQRAFHLLVDSRWPVTIAVSV